MNNTKKVIRLLKKHATEPDDASPNFVADFARSHGINLTSQEIVEISDHFDSPFKTLKELERTGAKYAIIKIDETKYWDKRIRDIAGQIDGVYIVNLTEPTHCCSIEVNFPAEQIRNFMHNIDGFEENELYELEYVEGIEGYKYFLESDSFEVVKTYEEGTYEDALENERANPSVC